MRFLRYSLGEIVLVVIGILIALQINTWNEERIEQKEIREYEESARAIWSLVSQLIDLNYDPSGLEDVVVWPEYFTSTDIERRLTPFRESDVFKSLAGMEWPPVNGRWHAKNLPFANGPTSLLCQIL